MTPVNHGPQRSSLDVSSPAENLFDQTDRYHLLRREVIFLYLAGTL
jgi:hypothetical protein